MTTTQDIGIMLGRLLERSESDQREHHRMSTQLDRIEGRLERGDERMDEFSTKIATLEAEKSKPKSDQVPAWERRIKGILPYAIAALTAWGTGSVDVALKVLGGLK